ncbi:MAG: glycosyltransferase family 4 protein, partial [Myxococcota bacterium]
MASTRVVYIVTVPQTADVLLRGQLRFLREEGFDVTLIASPGLELDRVACREGVEIVPVPIAREIAPLRDLKSLLGLVRALRRIQPDIVNASTPKAGLLGMIAAAVTSVPVRIYVLRGLRLEGESGAKRRLLAALERVTMSVAHEVICVSSSLQERVLQLRLAPRRKLRVIGEGSSNGVDVKRFSSAHSARRELGIQSNEFVAGFVGRLVADKGLSELRRTAEHFAQRSNAVFLVVGGTEGEDGSALDEVARLRRLPNVISTGQVQDTAPYYRAMDVLLFPSYREGFPNAPLEASAASVPTIGFRVTGTVDAIQDGKTGKLVEKSATKLIEALDYYLAAPEMARMDGQLARSWVSEAFSPRRIWTGVRDRYHIWGRIAHGRQTGWSRVSKRAFDAGVAAIGLGAVSPLIAATAVGLALSFRSRDVVFRQLRPGR